MKKYIFISFSLLAILLISYMTYERYFSPNSLGSKIFEAIEKDELGYFNTGESLIFNDEKQLTTTDLLRSMLLESGKKVTFQDVFDKESELFQFPSSVRNFKLLENDTEIINLNSNVDLSKSTYEESEYDKSQYKTYEEFVNGEIKVYSHLKSFKYDKKNTQIIYGDDYTKTSLKYKAETPTEDLIVNMIFLKHKHDSNYKLAAIYLK